MNRKTVLTILAVLLLVFYICSMAYIQSQHRQIQSTSSYSWSSRNQSSYHGTNTYSVPSPKPSMYSGSSSSSRSGSSRRDITPGPSTDGFYHPEDFYDWNRDDFSDYEEAEEYYYEHGGY